MYDLPHAPLALSLHLQPLSPLLTLPQPSTTHWTLCVPQTCQACSDLRASEFAVHSSWEALPQICLPPLSPSGFRYLISNFSLPWLPYLKLQSFPNL